MWLCDLTLESVDLDHELAMAKGKGRKVRPVYISAGTVRAVDRYLRERRRHRWAHLDARSRSHACPCYWSSVLAPVVDGQRSRTAQATVLALCASVRAWRLCPMSQRLPTTVGTGENTGRGAARPGVVIRGR
jgi:integrase